MAISTVNDNNPWNSKNAYTSYAEAVAAARQYSKLNGNVEMNIYQTSGGHWHYQPQYTSGGQAVSQQTYQQQYPTQTTEKKNNGAQVITEGDALRLGLDWNNLPSGYTRAGSTSKGVTSGGGTVQPVSAADELSKLAAELQAELDKVNIAYKEYDQTNPFNFDEAQARASSEEIYNPYYEAELSDFMKGIELQKQSAEGERSLLDELNRISAGEEKRALDEAVKTSEEGFAGSGLFFSGARQRATGLEKIGAAETAGKREAQYGYNVAENLRKLQNLGLEQSSGTRKLRAERTSTIEEAIAKQKTEDEAAWEVARDQYVSGKTGKSTGALSKLLSYLNVS